MEIKGYMPVDIRFGYDCILKNKETINSTGNLPFIVTGKSGAKKSGAFKDILDVISGRDYVIFDDIQENPDLLSVEKAARNCKKHKCDYVIGIGGGSALDAAKAIAVLAVNEFDAMDLFTADIQKALPIIAIPTTSGTGSEVTPYSILTVAKWDTKKSFASPHIFPKYAFSDPKYTYSLSGQYTLSTAFDAASHLFESYFSKKGNELSAMYAKEGLKAFCKAIPALEKGEYDVLDRENLMYASMLGGLAITVTGTTAMHALGYSMTYFHDMPHGFANLYFCSPYFEHIRKHEKEKVDTVMSLTGFSSLNEMCGFFLDRMRRPVLDKGQCEKYSHIAMMQSSIKATPGELNMDDIRSMYEKAGIR